MFSGKIQLNFGTITCLQKTLTQGSTNYCQIFLEIIKLIVQQKMIRCSAKLPIILAQLIKVKRAFFSHPYQKGFILCRVGFQFNDNRSQGPRGHASSVSSVYASQRAVLSSIFVSGTIFCLNQFPSLESAVSRRVSCQLLAKNGHLVHVLVN